MQYAPDMTNEPGLRERKNARTRDAIERAALELALEQGFEGTTVDQIAARADVSPRTVYTRYPTKEAIYIRDGAEGAARFDAAFGGDGSLVDRLVRFIEASVEAGRKAGELEALRTQAFMRDPALHRVLRGQLESAEAIIAQRTADELGVPEQDPGVRVFAAAVTGLFLTMLDRAVDHPGHADPIAASESAIRFLRGGLEALAEFSNGPAPA